MIQEVKLENITKQIGTTTILENICLTMKCGQIYGITGENGSGKTMLREWLLVWSVLARDNYCLMGRIE